MMMYLIGEQGDITGEHVAMADKIGAEIVAVLYDVDEIRRAHADSGKSFDEYLNDSGLFNSRMVYAAYVKGDI